MTTIIGISGKPGTVKMQYAFKIIQELRFHGYQTDLVSLAAPLYKEINGIINDLEDGTMTVEDILATHNLPLKRGQELLSLLHPDGLGEKFDYGYSRRNENMRKSLGLLGTQIRRKRNPDYWIEQLAAQLHEEASFAVLIDLRFPNEADFINAQGGLALRVELDEKHQSIDGGYKYQAGMQDITETALDEYSDFYARLYHETFDRVSFGQEILEVYDLPQRSEIIR